MLRNKSVAKIISLLVAIVLWAYVIAVENPPITKKFEKVPVQLLGLEMLTQSDHAILEGMDSFVDIVVSGKRSDIAKITADELIVTASVLGYTRVGTYYVQVEASGPSSVTLAEVRPAKIPIMIDDLVSVYKPINILFSGSFAEGTEAGRITIQPEQIEVRGAKTLVESVSYVGVEIPVEEIRRSNTSFSPEAVALDAQGLPVANVKLSSERVDVSLTLLNTKTVPLGVEITGQVSEKYEVTSVDVPQAVTIRGSKSNLEEIKSITAQPVDIHQITATTDLPIEVTLPKGVELANASSNLTARVGIKGISTQEFSYESTEISINGLGEGYNAYINTPSVVLKAVGKEAVLQDTAKEDFMLSVDLQGLLEGIYTVPISVAYDKVMNNVEIIPNEVHITVTETSNP